jgi:hypothetical protein
MVMAETQRSPESVRSTERSRAQRIRQDSAACVSLSSIYLSKSAGAKRPQTNGPAFAAPLLGKRGLSPGQPGGASCSIRRLPAHCRTPVHGAQTTLISINLYPCQRVGQEYLRPCPHSATPCLPQNGQHCRAHTPRGPPRSTCLRGVSALGSASTAHLTRSRTGRNALRPSLADGESAGVGNRGNDTGDAHQAPRTAGSQTRLPRA